MIGQTDIPSSSYWSPPTPQWTYDVFLSFRSEDTHRNFTDHLYTSLNQKGVFAFRDAEQLEREKPISPELLKAIEESRYVIVVLSRNYAYSTCCLDELAKSVECMKVMGQALLPVFYDVDPSEVQKQMGNFGKAFSKHEETFKDNTEKVQKWRDALTEVADLYGWHVQDGYESKIIQDIVRYIFTKVNQTISSIYTDLVGMDSRVNKVISCLDMALNNVCMLGMWGMGGIGKTTTAEVVFDRIRSQFEAYSFLANVREVTQKQGLVHLQKQLLSDILFESNVDVHNVHMGISKIRQRLCNRMVLIILDDVDQLEQLEALCDHSWFGSGSRIIITSRDEHLLRTFGVDIMYKVKALTDAEALQLFCRKAFKKGQVSEDFLKLANNVVEYANGLPLAIEVLGSFLLGRSVEVWSSALDSLKENPDKRITEVLKVSFDALEDIEKKVFLDIACFFKGEEKDRVTRILESSCGYRPDIDVAVLIEKSLLTLFGRKLWMHDLIQELGWEIVRRECSEDPGKRSRLWLPKDIIHVLVNNEGTLAVEGIFLNLPKQEVVHVNVDPFSKMCKLRLLKISNVFFSGSIKYLSNELQLLEWHAFPFSSLPSNFQSDKLVELHMHSSLIKQLWRGNKRWSMLKSIDLSDSLYLIATPNFIEVPNLEKLVLQGCTRLVEVHPSLGLLKNLILLNMRNCKSIESLPPFINLESLRTLTLSGSSRLKRFPQIEGNMKSLLELHLDGTAIEELPPSIQRLTGLTLMNMGGCKNLFRLPNTIQYLTSLETLILTGCSELDDIPEDLNCVECLEELDISGTAIRASSSIAAMKNLKTLSFQGCKDLPSKSWHSLFNCWWWGRKGNVPVSLLLPTSLSGLTSLTSLNLSDCNLIDGAIPDDLGTLISLRTLNLSANNFVCLPESIGQLSKLESLNLMNCSRLLSLPKKLPLSVRHVPADDCTSLIDFPDQFKVWTSAVSGMTTISALISSKHQESSTSSPLDQKYTKTWTSSTVPGRSFFSFGPESDKHQQWSPVHDLSLPNQVLQKDIELYDYKSHSIKAACYQNEIPEWFSGRATGDFISIPVPPDLKNEKKWMGVAIVFLVKGKPGVAHVKSDSEASDYFYKCRVETEEFQLEPFLLDWRHLNSIESSSELLCFFYVPCVCFPRMLNESFVIGTLFETNNRCMEVQKCGIRLVYEQDVEQFIQTFIPQSFGFGGRQQQQIHLLTKQNQQLIPSDPSNLKVGKATSESGWFNLDNDILRWEKFIPTCEEASTVLLRRNIESVLPRYLEGLNHRWQDYGFPLSGSPAWFNTEVGTSVTIELPQNLHKCKKWMGFSLCASLAVEHQHIVKEDQYHGSCRLEMGKHYMNLSLNLESLISDKHHLLIAYIPRSMIPELFTQTSPRQICLSFITYRPALKVKICGLRILYKQDLQGFVQTITQCILGSSDTLFGYYNDLVVKHWINLILLQSCKVLTEEKQSPRECDTRLQQRRFQLISQNFRNRVWSDNHFAFNFAGIEIPKWFLNPNKGDCAQIDMPPNLFDDGNWLGIAVSGSVSIHEHPNIIHDTPDSEFDREVICDLKPGVEFDNSLRLAFGTEKEIWLHARDLTWFVYISRALFPESWNKCHIVSATLGSNGPGLGLHECAIRLVFKEDVEELVQTLTLCELSSNCGHCKQAAEYGN
ncbi:TMV resistance protein N-like [Malus sylvestris]|uniref:TMV resistance protein N-like n=1 Tax=Malus sylvestris TaxID=3752 RepID=UPI0021ACFF47|nr:TMV resistance protein N-like [Malus sylvestris]XP_050135381.1 TMV resistance protein N-like [Malus sylvestris]